MEEGRTALPALCASCTGCLLEARSTGPHACWGIGFIMPLKWRVFIYLILYVIHLIVNGLRQLMYISKSCASAIAFMLPSDWYLSTSFSYIYWCRPHRWRQQRLHNSSTPSSSFTTPKQYSDTWSYSHHNHFICSSVSHKMLSDFSFAKLAQAAFCKGRAPRLS